MTNNCGIYIHIPFCKSRCAYCSFVSSVGKYDPRDYAYAVLREIDERVVMPCDTLYIGGGTPSALPRGLLGSIITAARRKGSVSGDCEITAEANPDSCTEDFLSEITAVGVNRLSLGVQSMNDKILSAIGRRHTSTQVKNAVKLAHAAGLDNVSCDLMLGLPVQSKSDVLQAVEEVCSLGVKHISVYALSVEEGTPLYNSGYRPDEDASADMYEAAYGSLKEHGFTRYEVSNFCLPGYHSRHNFKYWTRAPYVGIGAAAHSFDGKVRFFNTTDIGEYISGRLGRTAQKLSDGEALEEYIMLGLRTCRGISYSRIREMDETWYERKKSEICSLANAKLIEADDEGIKLSEEAYYVMNEIIVRLI